MAPHSASLRNYRHSTEAYSYLITTNTDLRRKLFTNPAAAKIVCDSLRYFDGANLVHSFAWVVMPDHIHWVLKLKEATLPCVLRRMKNWTGRELNRLFQTKGRGVWQRGFHDRCLVTTLQVDSAIKYVVHNPVVARLVRMPEEYPYLFIGEREPEWDGTFVKDKARQSQIGSHF